MEKTRFFKVKCSDEMSAPRVLLNCFWPLASPESCCAKLAADCPQLPWQLPNEEGFIEEGKKKAKKNLDVPLHGLWGKDEASPLKPEVRQPSSAACKVV